MSHPPLASVSERDLLELGGRRRAAGRATDGHRGAQSFTPRTASCKNRRSCDGRSFRWGEAGIFRQAGPRLGHGFRSQRPHDPARASSMPPGGEAMALAPAGFGKFGNRLLVGNFGDGRINAYDLAIGKFVGQLKTSDRRPIQIDGLWGITFGDGFVNAPVNTLFFAAGPGEEQHGLFGRLDVAPGAEQRQPGRGRRRLDRCLSQQGGLSRSPRTNSNVIRDKRPLHSAARNGFSEGRGPFMPRHHQRRPALQAFARAVGAARQRAIAATRKKAHDTDLGTGQESHDAHTSNSAGNSRPEAPHRAA